MMKEFWDERYRESGFAYGEAPNAFLVSHERLYQPGQRALAVADGEGRNGVWLAGRGLQVLSVDRSQVGLDKAELLAASRGVAVETRCVDLAEWDWPEAAFDHVVAVFAHFPPDIRQQIHRAMLRALKPGGVLLLEAFSPEQLDYESGGPRDPAMLYSAVMLREDFVDGDIEEIAETLTTLDEGPYHQGPAAVTRALVRRP
ncbi:tellurite resistance protein TehB, putative [Thioalkalivibrio sulfidiphilus HL-EbGr7]|uniref:Tellurite resistance protein TehB, putative n=1 Tax=Thioalkalivibrio sulfidiphilus (strain HL-EbGR7) TaxID=396588 RepID=B8GNE3_THISH|nr:class I SAM-dependent methyltransferase [Thioalkalivibrio sulfidiphilus]ACL73834.1 tellurite resistance protein TehB, putative [Thioalkalivibrio sulfidiphilus HL-EbGr7]